MLKDVDQNNQAKSKHGTWARISRTIKTEARHTKFQLMELLDTDHKTTMLIMFKVIKKEIPRLVSVE